MAASLSSFTPQVGSKRNRDSLDPPSTVGIDSEELALILGGLSSRSTRSEVEVTTPPLPQASRVDLPSSSSPSGIFSPQAQGTNNASSKLMIQVPQYTSLALESLTPMSLTTLFSAASPQNATPIASFSPANYLQMDPSSSMPLLGGFSSSLMIRGEGQSIRMTPFAGGMTSSRIPYAGVSSSNVSSFSSYPVNYSTSTSFGGISDGISHESFRYTSTMGGSAGVATVGSTGIASEGTTEGTTKGTTKVSTEGLSGVTTGESTEGSTGGQAEGTTVGTTVEQAGGQAGGQAGSLSSTSSFAPSLLDASQQQESNFSSFGRLGNIEFQQQLQQQDQFQQYHHQQQYHQQQQYQQFQQQFQQQQYQQQQYQQHFALGGLGSSSNGSSFDSNNQGLSVFPSSTFDMYSSASSASYNPYAHQHFSASSIGENILASSSSSSSTILGGPPQEEVDYTESSPSVQAAAAVSHLPNVLPFGERHPCVIEGCGSNFSNKAAMIRHVKAAHEGVRVSCISYGCLATFTDNSNMRKHYRTVHEGNAPRVPCTVEGCIKTFVSEWDKKKHIRAIHDKIRVACPFEGCGVTFTAESAKQKHVQTTHYGVRVPCVFPGCELTFYDRKAMRTHCANRHSFVF
jgi:hypothetical protein